MKLAIYGHCTIDDIVISGKRHEQIGGSACYGALMARQLKFDAQMVTRFGPDFPRAYLDQNHITYSDASVTDSGTTRFSLEISGDDRTLYLAHTCDKIAYEPVDADCRVISPLFGEISKDVFSGICRDSGFVLLDPQGFLRRCARNYYYNNNNNNHHINSGPGHNDAAPVTTAGIPCKVTLSDTDVDVSGIDAIKVNADEAQHMTGGLTGDEAMIALQRRGVSHVLYTDKKDISLLSGGKIYSIQLPNKTMHDTTGIGDMFCAAFCCTMIRERDILWALCFAGGAAQAALDSKDVGLLKVPKRGRVQTNASYFYNMIKFRNV